MSWPTVVKLLNRPELASLDHLRFGDMAVFVLAEDASAADRVVGDGLCEVVTGDDGGAGIATDAHCKNPIERGFADGLSRENEWEFWIIVLCVERQKWSECWARGQSADRVS